MPTDAAPEAVVPVAQDAADSQEPAATDATPTSDEATWKRRIAGKDQALTAAQQRAAKAEADAEELRRWKAERENADLSEYERAVKERDEARAEAAAARADAVRERLTRKYPSAMELFEDGPVPSEERLAAVEARLTGTKAESEEATPPRIDSNNPPRRTAPPPTTKDAALADLKRGLDAAFGRG